jgi:hypothetical protein
LIVKSRAAARSLCADGDNLFGDLTRLDMATIEDTVDCREAYFAHIASCGGLEGSESREEKAGLGKGAKPKKSDFCPRRS